jgi:iron complex outermembrane receptor protein
VTCRFDARFRWDLDLTPGWVVDAAGFLIVKDPRDPGLAGRLQPRIPDWRATLVGTWHAQHARSTSLSYRNSGRQHAALFDTATQARYNHPDPDAHGVVSHCRVFDAKVLYKLSP